MYNLEKAIEQWKKKLRKNPAFEDGDIEELESHLHDRIEQLKSQTFTKEEAFRKASEELGKPASIGNELYKTKTSKQDATPPWEESNWMPSLIPNYLKVALRYLKKEPSNSLINIFGLSTGILCSILIFLFVRYETSYDLFHKKAEQVYRLSYQEDLNGEVFDWAYSWSEWAQEIEYDFPEVIETARLSKNEYLVEYNSEIFRETNLYFGDESVLSMFDFEFIEGNPESALLNPRSVVLTEEVAEKYFGNDNALGKEVLLDSEQSLEVTGVIKSWPSNSHMQIDLLVPFAFLSLNEPDFSSAWIYTYLLLEHSDQALSLEEKLAENKSWFTPRSDFGEVNVSIEPITNIHLYSSRRGEPTLSGDILSVYIFSFIGILILAITSLNYINLTSAGSFKRFKEIGLRKTLGASKKQLFSQFLGESFLIAFLSLVIAYLLAGPVALFFGNFLGLTLNTAELYTLRFIGLAISAVFILSVLGGIYPALYLSSLEPVSTLKEQVQSGSGRSKLWVRNTGLVMQFLIATMLLISSLIVNKQVGFLLSKDTGFQKAQILTIPLLNTPYQENPELLRSNLLKYEGISNITFSSTRPGVQEAWVGTFQPEGMGLDQRNWIVPHIITDHNFIQTYEIELLQGRDFSTAYVSDVNEAFIINEAATANLGWEEPLGKKIQTWGNKEGKIIGVVKNFNFENLRQPVQPLVIHLSEEYYRYASVKIQTNNLSGIINTIEQEWNNGAAGYPFDFSFLDEQYNQIYEKEIHTGEIVNFFTLLAFTFACLGLWGLTSYKVNAKRKEIGVRKVLGASVINILSLINKEFLKLICISISLGLPFSFFLMNTWLNEFAYRINISWWILILPALATILLVLSLVSGLAIKSALMNPVKSLKNE